MGTSAIPRSFIIAPFGIDGASEGRGVWKIGDLSPKWLHVCSELIAAKGSSADEKFEGPLSHLRLKYVAENGAALVTILVHDRAVSLGAIASGKSESTDTEVLTMFAASVARSAVALSGPDASSFSDLPAISERPRLVVVPWPDPLITDQEYDLARELMIHFAGALLSSG